MSLSCPMLDSSSFKADADDAHDEILMSPTQPLTPPEGITFLNSEAPVDTLTQPPFESEWPSNLDNVSEKDADWPTYEEWADLVQIATDLVWTDSDVLFPTPSPELFDLFSCEQTAIYVPPKSSQVVSTCSQPAVTTDTDVDMDDDSFIV